MIKASSQHCAQELSARVLLRARLTWIQMTEYAKHITNPLLPRDVYMSVRQRTGKSITGVWDEDVFWREFLASGLFQHLDVNKHWYNFAAHERPPLFAGPAAWIFIRALIHTLWLRAGGILGHCLCFIAFVCWQSKQMQIRNIHRTGAAFHVYSIATFIIFQTG